jgi:hypothetical protein
VVDLEVDHEDEYRNPSTNESVYFASIVEVTRHDRVLEIFHLKGNIEKRSDEPGKGGGSHVTIQSLVSSVWLPIDEQIKG